MAVISPRVIHHAALHRMVTFRYRIRCETGLHIGAGTSLDLAGSNLPVVRNASGTPFIPGSSLRGILRSGVESICQSLDLNRAKPETKDSTASGGIPDSLIRLWNQLTLEQRLFGMVQEGKKVHQEGKQDEAQAQAYSSRLQISDARCLSADVAVELRDGVAISRESRTASGGGKYDLEVVPADTEFEGRMRFKNPEDYELGLLAQALMMLDQGMLLLGGKSARGLGWVRVSVTPPVDLSAERMLFGPEAPAEEEEFGKVTEALGRYLSDLRALAGEATQGHSGKGGD